MLHISCHISVSEQMLNSLLRDLMGYFVENIKFVNVCWGLRVWKLNLKKLNEQKKKLTTVLLN